MARWMAVIVLSLATSGCYRSHALREPAAGEDGGAIDAPGSCGEASDPEDVARFRELACDPRVFELPAGELELDPGPCPATRATTTPFVAAGVWPGLGGGPTVRRACIRVVSASEGSGVIAGSVFASWTVALAVPFDSADVELELVGVDSCDRILYGRRRVRSSVFEGPRRVAESARPILAIADYRRASYAYATADSVFLGEREPIGADHAHDLVADLELGRSAWLEGTDATSLRVHDRAGDWIEPVDREARLVRVLGDGSDQLLVVEPGRARLVELATEGTREVRSWSIPAGASNPVVYERALALQIGEDIRVWDLDTGAEREDRGGFEPGDRLFGALPIPFAMRGSSLRQLELEAELRAPPFREDDATLDPETRAGIGPILAVQAMMYEHPLLVVGEHGVGVVQHALAAGAVSPRVYDARERLGGVVRLARTVWQFRTVIVVDTPEGGSAIYDLSHDAAGWSNPCETWD